MTNVGTSNANTCMNVILQVHRIRLPLEKTSQLRKDFLSSLIKLLKRRIFGLFFKSPQSSKFFFKYIHGTLHACCNGKVSFIDVHTQTSKNVPKFPKPLSEETLSCIRHVVAPPNKLIKCKILKLPPPHIGQVSVITYGSQIKFNLEQYGHLSEWMICLQPPDT